ncbi:hypothetical protein ACFSL4_09330 [Streptomyces caeni]|uniref:Secreted protein n=1 Tax=Streptomyces caeni TaxID=2307231 RepID=A0ABW4INV7_9ACTN
MTGARMGARNPGRPGRTGLLLGLVVLITAHLAGAVHSSSFTGLPMTAVVAGCSGAGGDTDHGLTSVPGHDHKADGHIDHAADRPRDAVHGAVAGSGDEPPAAPSPTAGPGEAYAARARPPDTLLPVPHGSGTFALHCVWRQ